MPVYQAIEPFVGLAMSRSLASHKVRFNLKRPTPNLMELLSGPFVVVPMATWANAPLDDNGRPDYRRMDPEGAVRIA